jgi:phospholipid/cholesterol/gamma-HCH transport system ATP-binding protein
LKELDQIINKLGHDAAQEVLRNMGLRINRHFGMIGGFSTRRNTNELITMLPYSNLTEAESILQNFIKDFDSQVIRAWGPGACKLSSNESVDITVVAGIAEGRAESDIDSIIVSARSQQKEIGRLHCAAGE